MRKLVLSLLMTGFTFSLLAQESDATKPDHKRRPTLAINFIMNDIIRAGLS